MSDYLVQSVSRAMHLLDALSSADALALGDICSRVGLSKATVFRLLATLIHEGVVVQDAASKRYSLGPRLIGLGKRALESTHVVDAATAEMESLVERYHVVVTVNLPMPEAVLEARRLPRHGRGEFVPLGAPIPYHACASGLVFLAHDTTTLLAAVNASPLEKFASATVGSPEDLAVELGRIARNGYALVHDSLEEGVTAVAAPIFDASGTVALTIGATAPSGALDNDGWRALGSDLLLAAGAVTRRIGGISV